MPSYAAGNHGISSPFAASIGRRQRSSLEMEPKLRGDGGENCGMLAARRSRRVTLGFLAVVTAGAAGAWGGGGSKGANSDTASARGVEIKVTRGRADLDQPLNTALSGDEIEMARLTGYQKVNCSPFPAGDNPPPLCRSDEADGTSVEVFGTVTCDGKLSWVRPEDVPDA